MRHLTGSEIFVVDDDEIVRDTLTAVLAPEGCQITCFAECQPFLAAARTHAPACILLDVNMPGRSGLEMLHDLDAPHYPAPILIVSGQRDVPTAVHAIRGGALDFIEKPFEAGAMIARVRTAVENWTRWPARTGAPPNVDGIERLTPRERQVLAEVAAGWSNKEVGRRLGISPRTVEVHRARIMDKIGAKNTADLVRIVLSPGARH